jgi:tetratricopeptide (TPR) repeat protein
MMEAHMKALLVLLIIAIASAAYGQHPMQSPAGKQMVWLDNGLGNVRHAVTTKNAEAQKYFNQGLAYLYAFNHDEGIASFKQAAQLDPDLAMAYWGIALALGSNYNLPADEEHLTEAYRNLQKAITLAPKASQAEKDYIAALSKRYAKDPKTDQQKLAIDYKQAMSELVKKYPNDLDAATLYAESMMNLRPWQLWTPDGKPAEGTLEIISVLEGVLKRNPNHIGANHYYIHAVEASPNPERALAAANRLGGLAPSAGHLVHMPSHIYIRTGDFTESATSNQAAIIADRKYVERTGSTGFYTMTYSNHNIHMLAASYVGGGNYGGAIKASRQLEANVGPHMKEMPMLEMFMTYTLVTEIRFHKWDNVMKYPNPAPEMTMTNAIWHLARGLALADTGKTADADKELAALRELAKSLPADIMFGNNPAAYLFNVMDPMLDGEIALAKQDKAGIDTLRKAVAAQDILYYNEPLDFDIPVREWLGRALLRDGQYANAETIYREEIAKHPKDGRALFALAESLRKQGKAAEATKVRNQFATAWKAADTKLTVADLYGPNPTK